MAAFEISVNGERRFVGDDVKAITLVSDWVANRQGERISVHVGVGEPGDVEVQYLGADLRPGDEISIRVLAEDDEYLDANKGPESCSFCGSDNYQIESLVAGSQVAICDVCISAFHSVIAHNAPLPIGASIQEQGDASCGFCQKAPPEVAGLFVRNAAALCPECLRACLDLLTVPGDERG
jgi:hypothetical protein